MEPSVAGRILELQRVGYTRKEITKELKLKSSQVGWVLQQHSSNREMQRKVELIYEQNREMLAMLRMLVKMPPSTLLARLRKLELEAIDEGVQDRKPGPPLPAAPDQLP